MENEIIATILKANIIQGFMRVIGALFLFLISIILVIAGALLTVSIIFIYIGIPLLIFGVILLLISILGIFFGAVKDIVNIVTMPFQKTEKKRSNVIEVKKKDGVYRAK